MAENKIKISFDYEDENGDRFQAASFFVPYEDMGYSILDELGSWKNIVLTYSENHFVRHSLTIHNIQSVKQVRENDIVIAYKVVFGEENKVIELYTDKPERANNEEGNEKDGKKNVCMQACPVM